MLSVDDISEEINAQLENAFEYADSSQCISGECRTFTLSMHMGTANDDAYPTKCLLTFILQIKNETKGKPIYCLEIHGPIGVEQNCFLNKRMHKHWVWDVTLQFATIATSI